MPSKPDLWLILQEAYMRFGQKSPKFFEVMNTVNLVLVVVAGIPTLLTELDIILPEKWLQIVMKIVTAAGTWGYVMGKLTVKGKQITVTPDGTVISKSEVLPFTAKKEAELATVVPINNDLQ